MLSSTEEIFCRVEDTVMVFGTEETSLLGFVDVSFASILTRFSWFGDFLLSSTLAASISGLAKVFGEAIFWINFRTF